MRRPSGVRLRGEGDGGDGSLDSEQENDVSDLDENIPKIFLSPASYTILRTVIFQKYVCI